MNERLLEWILATSNRLQFDVTKTHEKNGECHVRGECECTVFTNDHQKEEEAANRKNEARSHKFSPINHI
jgi:hypothetical protein